MEATLAAHKCQTYGQPALTVLTSQLEQTCNHACTIRFPEIKRNGGRKPYNDSVQKGPDKGGQGGKLIDCDQGRRCTDPR